MFILMTSDVQCCNCCYDVFAHYADNAKNE